MKKPGDTLSEQPQVMRNPFKFCTAFPLTSTLLLNACSVTEPRSETSPSLMHHLARWTPKEPGEAIISTTNCPWVRAAYDHEKKRNTMQEKFSLLRVKDLITWEEHQLRVLFKAVEEGVPSILALQVRVNPLLHHDFTPVCWDQLSKQDMLTLHQRAFPSSLEEFQRVVWLPKALAMNEIYVQEEFLIYEKEYFVRFLMLEEPMFSGGQLVVKSLKRNTTRSKAFVEGQVAQLIKKFVLYGFLTIAHAAPFDRGH